jgi:hypothetical protein
MPKSGLLRAHEWVRIDDMVERDEQVAAVVDAHGGNYDGGQMGSFDSETG